MSYTYKIEVYSAAWCPNCTVLKNSLDEASIKYEVVDCDTDEGMSRAASLGIRGLPTTLVYLGDEVVRKIVGLQPTSVYTAYVKGKVDNDEGGTSE